MERIFYHAVIHPQNVDTIYSVMAIRGNKICYVGNDLDEAKGLLPEASLYDVKGKVILPSFVDSHTHPSCVALTNWRIKLPDHSLEALLEAARDYCALHSPEEVPYFFGESFQLTMFDEKGPKKELLDQYISDRPARLQDFTDHSCWYNSMALELLGITKGAPAPKEMPAMGKIVLDENGEPTGWIREVPDDSLDQILYRKIGWRPDDVPTEKNVGPFLKYMSDNGVATIMDAILFEDAIKLYHAMDQAGKLPFHYDACVLLDDYSRLEETIQEGYRLKKTYETDHIHIHTVKFFLDGTNELGDMASLEPLRTDPSGQDYGNINMTVEQLTHTMVRLNETGWDLHMHIVGDRAFRTACDAMEEAKAICGDTWRMDVTSAHCELVHPADMVRPAELGMSINWSCHWAGGYFGEKSRDYLGQERFDSMYDFTTMLKTGAEVAFSSDVFSYKEANRAMPLFGIQVSATRVDPEYPLEETRFPGHVRTPLSAKLSVKDLIKGYTYTGAKQLRLDHRLGSIAVGKDATFLILSEDPYAADPFKLSSIYPIASWFEGRVLFEED